MKTALYRAGAFVLLLGPLSAQDPGTRSSDPELEALRNRIRELEERVQEVEGAQAPATSTGGDRAFNPSITVFGDFTLSLSDDGSNDEVNRFSLREVEVDFRAPITEWADAVMLLALEESLEDDGTGGLASELELRIEEGYAHLHPLPLDTSLKLGKFRPGFGANNRLHTHALPQVTRPPAVQAFLGPEGMFAVGASANWHVPNPFDEHIELEVDVFNSDGGEESPILGGPGADNPAVLGHLRWARDLSEHASFEAGGSYLFGHTTGDSDDTAHVFGADAGLFFGDGEHPDQSAFVLMAELFWARNDVDSPTFGAFRNRSFGAYAFARARVLDGVYVGLRGDYTEFPDGEMRGPFDSDRGFSPYVTWYAHEHVRFRFEYQFVDRDVAGMTSDENFFWLQCTFAFGAPHTLDHIHPAHHGDVGHRH